MRRPDLGASTERAWTLDELRRIQATLMRRVAERDPDNIHAVGFGPKCVDGEAQPTLAACFLVHHKRNRVADDHLIRPTEPVRLLRRSTGRFEDIVVVTDIIESRPPRSTGVSIRAGRDRATTATVVRWTTAKRRPRLPSGSDPGSPRWRWGVLTVSHVFGGGDAAGVGRVERVVRCGRGPEEVRGRTVVRGHIPGGPDVALVETGLDRLWLSGFLTDAGRAGINVTDTESLMRWVESGVTGNTLGDGWIGRWRFGLLHPVLSIDGLGILKQIIRVTDDDHGHTATYKPGTSGAVMVTGGNAVGLQVASVRPDFRVGYVQAFDTSLPWLKRRLKATHLEIVQLIAEG